MPISSETSPWSNQSGCSSKRKFPSEARSEKSLPPNTGIVPSSSAVPPVWMPIARGHPLDVVAEVERGDQLERRASARRDVKRAHVSRVASSAQPYSDL